MTPHFFCHLFLITMKYCADYDKNSSRYDGKQLFQIAINGYNRITTEKMSLQPNHTVIHLPGRMFVIYKLLVIIIIDPQSQYCSFEMRRKFEYVRTRS